MRGGLIIDILRLMHVQQLSAVIMTEIHGSFVTL